MTKRHPSQHPSHRGTQTTIARRTLSLAPTDLGEHRTAVLRGQATGRWSMTTVPHETVTGPNPSPATVAVLDPMGCERCPADEVALGLTLANDDYGTDLICTISIPKAEAARLAEVLARLAA